MKFRLAAMIAIAFCFFAYAPCAIATTRYVTPGGSLSDLSCAVTTPCNIEHAVNTIAVDGDEVIVAPGGYTISSALTWPGKSLNLHGQDGQPRPNVISPVSVVTLSSGTGSTVRHMRLEGTSAQSAISVNSSSLVTFSDLIVVNSVQGSVGYAVVVGVTTNATATIRDSVIQATGGLSGAMLIGGLGGDASVTTVNVTAYAGTPPSGKGIIVASTDSGGSHPGSLTAKNSIARGTAADVDVNATGLGTAPATANFSNSNFRPSMSFTTGAGALIVDGGGNQSAEPLFTNPAAEDFHQLAGSPTIDAGSSDPLLGGLDFDGDARVLGSAPDIGADEFSPPAPGTQPAAPKLTLKGSKRQRVLRQRGLIVRASCDQACTAAANASVSIPGAAKLYKFRKASKSVAAGATATLKLRLASKTRAAIRRALSKKRKLKTKITVVATATGSGLPVTATLTVRLRR